METGTEEIIRTIREDPFLSVMFSCYERAGEYAWDKNVLDYGCGYGWGSWWVAAWAREVAGYDPDRERIRFAQENFKSFKRENLSFTWNVDELEKGQYNMICLFMVISYIEEKEAVLKQAVSCLAQSGTLWVSYKVKNGEEELRELITDWVQKAGLKWIDSDERILSDTEIMRLDIFEKTEVRECECFMNGAGR